MPGAEVDDSTHGLGMLANHQKPGDGIGDVREVPTGFEGAEMDRFGSPQCLRDDGRNNSALGLPRTVRIERAYDGDGEVKGTVVAQGKMVRGDFGGCVGRLRDRRVRLVDR